MRRLGAVVLLCVACFGVSMRAAFAQEDSPSVTVSPTPSETLTPTPSPTDTPTATPTPTPTDTPTQTPAPTPSPTSDPSRSGRGTLLGGVPPRSSSSTPRTKSATGTTTAVPTSAAIPIPVPGAPTTSSTAPSKQDAAEGSAAIGESIPWPVSQPTEQYLSEHLYDAVMATALVVGVALAGYVAVTLARRRG